VEEYPSHATWSHLIPVAQGIGPSAGGRTHPSPFALTRWRSADPASSRGAESAEAL